MCTPKVVNILRIILSIPQAPTSISPSHLILSTEIEKRKNHPLSSPSFIFRNIIEAIVTMISSMRYFFLLGEIPHLDGN